MSITQIKTGKNKGKYRVRIQPTDNETGKTIPIPSKVTKTNSKREAKQLEEQMWVQYRAHKEMNLNVLDQPLAKALDHYVEEERSSGRWSSITTYDNWKYTVKLVSQYFGKKKVKDIKEKDMRSFARNYISTHKATVAPHSTLDRQLQNLRSYFATLKEYGVLKNPIPMKPLTKFFRRDEMNAPVKKYVFTNNEINVLKDRIYRELGVTRISYWTTRIAILIALDTGMRPQEIQALKWSQITNDGSFKVFRINDSWNEKEKHLNGHLKSRPHGESRLTLPLSEPLLQLLNKFRHCQLELLKENGLTNFNDRILLNITDYHLCALGYPITQKSMNDMLKQLSKKVGVNNQNLNISMYTCRHTVATKLGNTPGMSYPWAASRLGHSLKMFMRTYVHVDEDRNEEMLRLIAKR